MGEDALDNEDLATSIERGERRKTRLFAVIAGVLLAASFLFCLVVGRYTTGRFAVMVDRPYTRANRPTAERATDTTSSLIFSAGTHGIR